MIDWTEIPDGDSWEMFDRDFLATHFAIDRIGVERPLSGADPPLHRHVRSKRVDRMGEQALAADDTILLGDIAPCARAAARRHDQGAAVRSGPHTARHIVSFACRPAGLCLGENATFLGKGPS